MPSAPMKIAPQIFALLALALTAHAEPLLVPKLVGDWQPIASASTASESMIVEPAPGQFYLFFVKPPAPASTKTKSAPKPEVTRVYYSTDRTNFGVKETNADALRLVTTFPIIDAHV